MASRPSKPGSHSLVFAGGALVFAIGMFGVAPYVFSTTYVSPESSSQEATSSPNVALSDAPRVPHVARPEAVRGIYMTQCVVGTPTFRQSLVDFVDETELNAIVIDIKDFTGRIAFPTDNPILADSVSDACGARDMKEFVAMLHEKDIYVIGRITVFQDPYYTKLHPEQSVQSVSRPGEPWKDHKGLSFIDPSAKAYWEYVVELSRVAYGEIGFDELNYDYIRWPSDGNMKDVAYPAVSRAEAIERFWEYLGAKVRPMGAVISADLFGYTTMFTDDLGIGQVLERALPHFDYIYPMVYPSHYNKNFAGLADVNKDPYTVVAVSLAEAVKRTVATTTTVESLVHTPLTTTVIVPAHDGVATTTEVRASGSYAKPAYASAKIVPWLQSFDYPVPYTSAMVAAQIKATYDTGLNSYIFWDAGNKYTSLRQALPKVVAQTESN